MWHAFAGTRGLRHPSARLIDVAHLGGHKGAWRAQGGSKTHSTPESRIWYFFLQSRGKVQHAFSESVFRIRSVLRFKIRSLSLDFYYNATPTAPTERNMERPPRTVCFYSNRMKRPVPISKNSCQMRGGVRSGPGAARTILLFHIISARPSSKQPRMVRTFLPRYIYIEKEDEKYN